uniref:Uncharacterized protein n=1 Tax=Romanomermis culicivorax TaxID=13658 RepID=A0A915HKY1_ROMCU
MAMKTSEPGPLQTSDEDDEQTSDDDDEDLFKFQTPPPLTEESKDVRRMAPETTQYDLNGTKYSFDYPASCATQGFKTIEELKNIKCEAAA